MTERPPVSPWIVLSIGVFAISTGALFARMADAPPLVISAYRVGLATLFLAPFTLRRAVFELSRLGGRDIMCGAVSGVFLALHFATWISSLFYTSVASSVVIVNAIPLWTGLFSPMLTGDPFSRALKRGLAVALPGALIISWGDFATGWTALWGDFLALLGSLFAALYILLGRRIRPRVSLGTYVTLNYGTAAAVLWTAVLILGLPPAGYTGATWSAFFLMALVPQILGHSSYNWALRWMTGGAVSLCLLGEPVGSSILAALLLGEPLTLVKVAGGGLILAGIVLASREERQEAPPA